MKHAVFVGVVATIMASAGTASAQLVVRLDPPRASSNPGAACKPENGCIGVDFQVVGEATNTCKVSRVGYRGTREDVATVPGFSHLRDKLAPNGDTQHLNLTDQNEPTFWVASADTNPVDGFTSYIVWGEADFRDVGGQCTATCCSTEISNKFKVEVSDPGNATISPGGASVLKVTAL